MAQTKVLRDPAYPVGTSVSAYKRSSFPPPAGGPGGTAVATATVAADGSLTFSSLPDNQNFWAYASVNSADAYAAFDTLGTAGTTPSAAQFLIDGSTSEAQRGAHIFKPLSAAAIGTEATIWTPAAGKSFRLLGGIVSVGVAAGNVSLKDNTGGTVIAIIPKAALDTPIRLDLGGNGILSAAANNVLTATGASTSTISGTIWGCEE